MTVLEQSSALMKRMFQLGINVEMVITILPNPKFIIKNRKVVYQFLGYVSVNENLKNNFINQKAGFLFNI